MLCRCVIVTELDVVTIVASLKLELYFASNWPSLSHHGCTYSSSRVLFMHYEPHTRALFCRFPVRFVDVCRCNSHITTAMLSISRESRRRLNASTAGETAGCREQGFTVRRILQHTLHNTNHGALIDPASWLLRASWVATVAPTNPIQTAHIVERRLLDRQQ
ncbi:hypothetical protein BDN71DRAFT_1026187 [Pleurotus eryngii]|uniref:Uncharacterized protein n=1 Tax=Pleurotus eryngii TaxID=5323 RepID=A0A9P5ZUA6_PLEER|nr:hypothetical protein BDN71DRAFT_1026187 [Pleurotus eryngii]